MFKLYVYATADTSMVPYIEELHGGCSTDAMPVIETEDHDYMTAIAPMLITRTINTDDVLVAASERTMVLPDGTLLDKGGLVVDYPYEELNMAALVDSNEELRRLWFENRDLTVVACLVSDSMEPDVVWQVTSHMVEDNGVVNCYNHITTYMGNVDTYQTTGTIQDI